MTNTTRLAALAGMLLPLAAGCHGVTVTPGTSPETAPDELAQAICPKVWGGCCTAAAVANNMEAGTDEASCETKTEGALQNDVATIQSSEAKGRSTYDGEKVEACAAFIRQASCAELNVTTHLAGLPACASFATPKVAAGGACSADWECTDGVCDKTGVASGADGACAAMTTMATTTMATPAPAPSPGTCFYTSGCNVSGRGAGAPSLLLALACAVGASARGRGRRRS